MFVMFYVQVNTFQCILATNEFESFIFFLYNDGAIQWSSVGEHGDPFYGEPIVGISAGDHENFFYVHGPSTGNILDIDKTSNVGIPGVWIFKVGTGKNFMTNVCYICILM